MRKLVYIASPLSGDRISPGMAAEEQLAKGLGIPVQHVGTEEILYRPPDELCWEDEPELFTGPAIAVLIPL